MKKFLSVMLLAMTLIFVSGQAEAREVYVGSYSDGTAVYLLTETINFRNINTSYEVTCTVRAGGDRLWYGFECLGGSVSYRNSEGYNGYIDDGSSPVAAAIYRYIKNNY